jgi:hypothetical protein
MKKLEMYCITNKVVNLLNETNYKIGWVGKEKPPSNYITCNTQDNIFFKEQYYSELTFQYWYWKNMLDLDNSNWIGFCQKRRFWVKKNSNIEANSTLNFINQHLSEPYPEWESFDAIICKSINVNKVKKMKLIKRGFRSIIKDPTIFFNEKKRTLALHFDMHHGHGNLSKAINVMEEKDRLDFKNYVNTTYTYNPHIMFIAKSATHKKWFDTLFPWLERCEKIFELGSLKGYDTQRLYAYLAERYLSFWFNKYTKTKEWPWVFLDTHDK